MSADFGDFYASTRTRLLRALVLITGDVSEAEDALQEAYVRAADRWRRLDDPEQWVLRVAINVSRDGFRRRLRRQRAHRAHGALPLVQAAEPTTVLVVSALRELPREQREVLVLHYLRDLPVDAVARELRRPVGTVKAQLSRGRTRLAAVLEPSRSTS